MNLKRNWPLLSSLLAIVFVPIFTSAIHAKQKDYNLSDVKSEKLIVTKSNYSIDVAPSKAYDKYIISVSGEGGYSKQFESNTPSLYIDDFILPYDGKYSYEIRAIKYVADIEDSINNGRTKGAKGRISIVDTTNGQFYSESGSMKIVDQDAIESRGKLPTKLEGGYNEQ